MVDSSRICKYCGRTFKTPQARASHEQNCPMRRYYEIQENTGILEPDEDELISSLKTKISITVEPDTIIYFDYAKNAMGFAGSFSEFVNRCVITLFSKVLGLQVGVIKTRPEFVSVEQVADALNELGVDVELPVKEVKESGESGGDSDSDKTEESGHKGKNS